MKKVWLKVEEELNYRVLDGVNIEDLWSRVSEVWPKGLMILRFVMQFLKYLNTVLIM